MKQFKGTIADKKLSDFNQYDNKITKYKDRIEYVEGFLYEEGFVHEFFAEYFSNYYGVSPSQDGYLAEEDAVCKLLDILGTYILGANDVESHRKIEYRFWKSEREYRDYKDSENVSASTSDDNGNNVEVIDMFVDKKNDKNQKIVKDTTVYVKDVKEIPEIKQLQLAIEYLKSSAGLRDIQQHALALLEREDSNIEETDRLKYIAKNTQRFIDSYAKTLRDNQVAIKEAIKRPIKFNNVLKDEGVPNKLDSALFSDENLNKKLLPMIGADEDLMSDIGILLYDFNCLLNRMELTDREQEIITLFRQGYKQKELPEVLNVKKNALTNSITRLSRKVAEFYVKDLYEKAKKNK